MPQSCFRVGTFNTYNLVLPEQLFYQQESYTPQEYRHKVWWSRQQLKRMMADVVVFQEVFHRQAIEDVCADLYPTVISPHTEENQPRVAIATHYKVESWRTFPELEPGIPFRRPPLYVSCRLPCGQQLGVLGLHLKSRRPLFTVEEDADSSADYATAIARSLQLRTKEAHFIRQLAEQLSASAPLLIVGDFNDGFSSATTQLISASPDGSALFRSAGEEFKRRRGKDIAFTHIYSGRYEEIDLILCSEHFFEETKTMWLKHIQYYTDHLADQSLGQYRGILSAAERSDSPFEKAARRMEQASDHGQVVATFEVEHHHPAEIDRRNDTESLH